MGKLRTSRSLRLRAVDPVLLKGFGRLLLPPLYELAQASLGKTGMPWDLVRREARRRLHPPAEVEEGGERGNLPDRLVAPADRSQRVDVRSVQ